MNQCSSPVLQTNEVSGSKYSPNEEENNPGFLADRQRELKKPSGTFAMSSDDLQKIRRSNHSSHHARRREIEDDDVEHDEFIKSMWYPGLESTLDESAEFFDDTEEEDHHLNGMAVEDPMSMNVSDHQSRLDSLLQESAQQLAGGVSPFSGSFSASLSSQDMFSRGMIVGDFGYDEPKMRL